MFGPYQKVILQLLELPQAAKVLEGLVMELKDGAYPCIADIIPSTDAMTAFKDADVVVMVGARPRGPGMERADLLTANAKIFQAQGEAINQVAKKTVKVCVVGNPANTNAHRPATQIIYSITDTDPAKLLEPEDATTYARGEQASMHVR